MSIRAARARRDESLIIIIHKTLRWESARRETKQERCAAKQERVPSLPRGLAYVLLIPGREPEYSTMGRGCARVSRAETQSLPASAPIRAPRRWRRLTYALPLRVPLALPIPLFLPACSYLILYWTHPLGPRPTSKQTADLLFGKRSHGSFFNATNDVSRMPLPSYRIFPVLLVHLPN